jgi:glycosyltransferase involved in cell wall biosynthesis
MTDLSSFVKELNEIINQPIMPEPVANASMQPIVQLISSEKKIKILLVSTHVNQVNGYSKVMYHIIKQLTQPWIQLVHFGTQKLSGIDIGRPYPKGVKVIDATALDKEKQPGFALSELPNTILSEKPDVVFIYNDLSVICAYIEEIRKVISRRTFKIWAYVDMTYAAPPQGTIDILNRDVERIFCFTKSWKDSITSQGITRPVDVMNHGVDSTMFRSIPKELARQTLGLPKDIFIFTSLNRNIPRKRLDLLVMSFVTLIVRFPTKPIFLLLVADKGERGGFQLFDIFARELKHHNATVDMFGNRLMLTSKDTCFRDEDINMLYNCADVGISCAEGEGFGLCTFEQMSVGVPQIVPEINGYTEYCTSENSLLVKPSMRYYIPQVYHSVPGEAQMVDPNVVAKMMERYVFDEALRKQHGTLGKEKASSYTWEKCVAIMIKRLHALQEEED